MKSLDDGTLKATIDHRLLNLYANLSAAIFSLLIAIRWDVCNYRRCYYLQLEIALSTGRREIEMHFAIAEEKQWQSKRVAS